MQTKELKWGRPGNEANNLVNPCRPNLPNSILDNTGRYRAKWMASSHREPIPEPLTWTISALGHWATITWQSPDNHLTITWQPPDSHLTITWQPPDSHLTITWPPPDNHLTVTWQPPDNHSHTSISHTPGFLVSSISHQTYYFNSSWKDDINHFYCLINIPVETTNINNKINAWY